ncbi:MAG: glycoside hydrolase family 57 protein [Chromatiales bacterium]|nr:glycoside hydrolase family 57 protein [Chromatiales bacterium]MDX9766573.1 glycoside hydrolase family 57 protein [Ectothiorhodospiraceae bacterium]
MSAKSRGTSPLKVVLCWHMHQPQYRDLLNGQYHLPWSYLHATKDYVDMVAHLEAVPEARAVVNFAPVLLEQIDDCAQQVQDFLQSGMPISDPLLAALANPVLPNDREGRLTLAEICTKANAKRLIDPYPAYRLLVDMVKWLRTHGDAIEYLSDAFLADLLVWYHLAWLGETVKRNDVRALRLLDKGRGYTLEDRRLLLELIGDLLGGVIGRYRHLAEQGRVELSFTPYAHPIMPLLLDINSAREAVPDMMLPGFRLYPGGEERVRWHIQRGIETFETYFGMRPQGCWPSEGSVSTGTLRVLADYGLGWTASGETVLANSLRKVGADQLTADKQWLYRPYTVGRDGVRCFFRDDGLSDAIGFKYLDWHADDAVANFVTNLEAIATATKGNQDAVVSVILDGENAWEYYPNNGYYFLSALYQKLAAHPDIELTTYSDALAKLKSVKSLPGLVAGSWVYGSFSTWIGDRDKNRGWEMLAEAKQAFDKAVRMGRLGGEQLDRAMEQLAVCEGSDWCWWFGDYNPALSVSDFERLYRQHLVNLYQLIGETPPEYLAHSFTHGGGEPTSGGVMRQGQPAA